MIPINKYVTLGMAVVVLAGLFLVFSDEGIGEYDHTGIVHDIRSSSSGYTFYIDMSDGSSLKCFSRSEPSELGYYGISGDLSDDGSIFFVSDMVCFDDTS